MSRITTPFKAESTAAEVIAGVDLTGKRAVVTGGASGIGLETARALATAGAEVTLPVRNTDAGQRAAADIRATTGRDDVRVVRLDLTDRSTIDAFSVDWTGPLRILVAFVLSVVAMLQPDPVISGIVAGLVFTSFLLTISAHEYHWAHGWHEAHRHHGIEGHAHDHLDDYQRFVQVLSD